MYQPIQCSDTSWVDKIWGGNTNIFLDVYVELARLTFAISSRILRFRTVIRLLESKFCPGMSISSAYLSSSSSSLLWSFSWRKGKEGKTNKKKRATSSSCFPSNQTLIYLYFLKLLLLLLLLLAVKNWKI